MLGGMAESCGKDAPELHHCKFLRKVSQLLSALHDSGCARDRAANRELHFDDYVLLVLLWMFNSLLSSLRDLQRVADLDEVQRRAGIKRFSLGSFSESCRVFEPQKLKAVVEQLAGELHPVGRQAIFKDVPGVIELVDGTLLRTLESVAEAMWLPSAGRSVRGTHAWKLHLNFDVDRHIPASWELTDARGEGKSDERTSLQRRLQPEHTYVMDRGYAKAGLFDEIHRKGSSYVCRIRDNSVLEVREDRALDEAARQAGVMSDQIVRLGCRSCPEHPVRVVCVRITPHEKRGKMAGGSCGPKSDGILRIATDLLDVPAHVIAFLYQYRWTLEIFIRFFKQILGCRHLLSTKRQGIEIQIYAAIICCMLINITTGKKPNQWMLTLMSLYLAGWATAADVVREVNRPDNTGTKTRAKDALWKKLGWN
jgi:hypothetical protein